MNENPEKMQMSMNPRIQREREAIISSRRKSRAAVPRTFFRLSGPGWLQSATESVEKSWGLLSWRNWLQYKEM
jgi:hypothetical protein